MKRPAAFTSAARDSRGLLLVEAVLAAAVIAVGLVLITRGLSGQLQALRSLEDHERLLALAHGKLLELESVRGLERSIGLEPRGRFPEPDADMAWTVTATPRSVADGEPADQLSDIRLSVTHAEMPSVSTQLSEVWRAEDVPEPWR